MTYSAPLKATRQLVINEVVVEVAVYTDLSAAQTAALEVQVARYGAFVGRPARSSVRRI